MDEWSLVMYGLEGHLELFKVVGIIVMDIIGACAGTGTLT